MKNIKYLIIAFVSLAIGAYYIFDIINTPKQQGFPYKFHVKAIGQCLQYYARRKDLFRFKTSGNIN